MASIANLVLADGQTTPANHTFNPSNPQDGAGNPSLWLEKTSGNALTYLRVTMQVKFVSNGVSKVKVVIATPKPAVFGSGCCVDSNTPQVAYTCFANLEFSLPSGSSRQDRLDILAYAKNFLSNAVATSAVADFEPAW